MTPLKKPLNFGAILAATRPGTQRLQIPGAIENMNLRATGDPEMDWITHSAGLIG